MRSDNGVPIIANSPRTRNGDGSPSIIKTWKKRKRGIEGVKVRES